MTSGEGILFAEVMNDFGKKITELGPIGKAEGINADNLKARFDEVMKLVPYIKIVEKEKLALRLDDVKEYDTLYTDDEINKLLDEAVSYYIEPDKCQACGICVRKCPASAIKGGKNLIHIIDQEKCIKCGTCFESCPPRFGAIKKIIKEPVPAPILEEARIIARGGK
jgi:F420-non-reducing hydrogenase iron-sulfur subunit